MARAATARMSVDPTTARDLPDERLMELVGEGEPVAFEEFYDRYERQAYSLAYRILGQASSAEDAAQEAFLAIWRNGSKYDSARGSAGAWALGIVRNRAIDVLRSKASRTPRLDHDDDAALEGRQAPERTEKAAIERETRREVQGVLSELPTEQAKVIKLAYFGGFSQSEISRMLDLPLGTIKGRMRLGLEKIRASFAEGGL